MVKAHTNTCLPRALAFSVALSGDIAVNWAEVTSVANLPEYRNFTECETLVREVADDP